MYKKILKIRRGKSDYSPFSNFPLPLPFSLLFS